MSSRASPVPIIGLVGGIGSGKSFIAQEYARRWPVAVVEGDAAGHQVLEESEIISQLREAFGDEVVTAAGRIDRKQISRRVFGPGLEQKQARDTLEAIVHPPIRRKLLEQIILALRQPNVRAVLLDAAILLEAGWKSLCDAVIFVDCPLEERLERVSHHRGWTAADLSAREASQLSLDQKRKEADFVVVNSRTQPLELPSLDHILDHIAHRAALPPVVSGEPH